MGITLPITAKSGGGVSEMISEMINTLGVFIDIRLMLEGSPLLSLVVWSVEFEFGKQQEVA